MTTTNPSAKNTNDNVVTPLLAASKNGTYNSVTVGETDGGSNHSDSSSELDQFDGTTPTEAFLNLLKGYFGAGMLSLPWALSQLGIVYGCVAVFVMAFWSSYNCWTVVKLKRFIERTQLYNNNLTGGAGFVLQADTASVHSGNGGGGGNVETASSIASSSVATTRTNLTFPDVGEWAYGSKFQSYVSACVCTQQLAICTVFISFIGENLLAVLDGVVTTTTGIVGFVDSHVGVMTIILPCVLSLSFIPTMKSLAPVMALGTILLGICVALLGVIMGMEWDSRPEELPQLKLPQMPLAACAILYSYEGICLILPIESSMKEPQHFQKVFVGTMTLVAFILAAFATICVVVFGDVNNGSITAFLLEAYRDDPSVTFFLMAANTAVSFSVLLSYPLQLFPALELIGTTKFAKWIGCLAGPQEEEDDDLSGFEPLPPLPEGEVADLDSLPSEHQYGLENADDEKEEEEDAKSLHSQLTLQSLLPKMVMPGDSMALRAFLVLMTYTVAVAVPNVQALISLVGALAGSSTALLIPPILELAWIQTLEEHRATKAPTTTGTATTEQEQPPETVGSAAVLTPPGSPFVGRRIQKTPYVYCGGKYWASKIKCYFLFLVGCVFAGIGTYASLMDIIRIYSSVGGEEEVRRLVTWI